MPCFNASNPGVEKNSPGMIGEARPLYGHVGAASLLGVHKGVAYYLLYNGVLGDKRPPRRQRADAQGARYAPRL